LAPVDVPATLLVLIGPDFPYIVKIQSDADPGTDVPEPGSAVLLITTLAAGLILRQKLSVG
jgi:hypothetical protein